MTKGAQALNTSATKFEVLSHASERDEQSKARVVREVSQGAVPFKDEVDTMVDCIELTKETLQ